MKELVALRAPTYNIIDGNNRHTNQALLRRFTHPDIEAFLRLACEHTKTAGRHGKIVGVAKRKFYLHTTIAYTPLLPYVYAFPICVSVVPP
ncbi:40s ribosomal protein s18 [Moniliophthora roreri]|nr:40s ribosomal protein s18 [Moniliophthora roreri]